MKEIIFALLSAIVWGTAPLLFKLGLRGSIPPLAGILIHNATATLFALIAILLTRNSFSYPLKDVLIVSFGGFVSGFIGLLLYYKALKIGDVSIVAPIAASSPLWASLFAFLFLGESINAYKITGSLLIFAGITLLSLSK